MVENSWQTIEQTAGVIVILLVALDVFLTVLYARAGIGLFAYKVGGLVWRLFRVVAKPFGRHSGTVLSICGPMILVTVVGFWAFTLTLGAALIIHPNLGTSVKASSGETKTDFVTALFAGGSSMSIVGSGSFSPATSGFQLVYLLNSLIGMTVVSLTLTYLMQVYNALQRRNALGLRTHHLSAETDDAAVLIAGLGPEGKFEGGYSQLSTLAQEISQAKEAHHFYPVLFYFRFKESYYSVSQFCLVSLDTATLIKSALNDEKFGWLKKSAAIFELSRSAKMLPTLLVKTFVPGRSAGETSQPDNQTEERWRRRYFAALRHLNDAGIETVEDEESGADMYVSLRREWDDAISSLAPYVGLELKQIDRAGNTDRRTGREIDLKPQISRVD